MVNALGKAETHEGMMGVLAARRARLLATADDIAKLTTVLGHAPRGFEAYAQESTAAWSATAARG